MRAYEKPKMFAELFVANQYVAACAESFESIPVTTVRCTSDGHQNRAEVPMFTDSNTGCLAKYNPGVGEEGADGYFHTSFRACGSTMYCYENAMSKNCNNRKHNIIDHDTIIDLSNAEKYQLS